MSEEEFQADPCPECGAAVKQACMEYRIGWGSYVDLGPCGHSFWIGEEMMMTFPPTPVELTEYHVRTPVRNYLMMLSRLVTAEEKRQISEQRKEFSHDR